MKDDVIKKTTGMMAATIDCLSANYERFGVQLRRELSRRLISRGGAWVSLAFVFQDRKELKEFGSIKVMFASFKNDGNLYKRFSYFNIKTKEEAQSVCEVLKDVFNL